MRRVPLLTVIMSLLLAGAYTIAFSQTNHTITLDGTNDFNAPENLGSEAGRTGYITWDASNFYIGITGNPMVSTSSNLYVVFDTNPVAAADPRSAAGRSDQPTGESGGAVYPFNADVVYLFYGAGSDDDSPVNPAPGSKFTVEGSWSGVAIPSGVRIIRKSGSTTELEIPFSDIGISNGSDFNVIAYLANNVSFGNNWAQWPTGNWEGNNPTLKDFYMYTRTTGISSNSGTHYSYREHLTGGYTIGGTSFGSIFFIPASATTYNCGSLTTLGYHLYLGPNATFAMGNNTAALNVGKHVTNEGTLTLSSAIGGDINLGGNWTRTGTFTPNNRAVGFNGSAGQTISGVTTFDYLTLNNSAGLTLNDNITVEQTLTLTSGDVTLNGKTLTLGSSATLDESGGRIKGTTGSITTTRTLTAPSSVNVGGLGAELTTTADLGSTTITRTHAQIQDAGNNSIFRAFNIAPTNNSGLNATLVFRYKEQELSGIAEANLRLFRSTNGSTNWTNQGGTVDAAANTVTKTGIDAFSHWTLADVNSPLPIQLSYFTATFTGGTTVVLRWRTLSEVNNYGFYIQRKRSGDAAWGELENNFVPGAGTTNEPLAYSWLDQNADPGDWLYRLRQVDLDGRTHHTEPVQVHVVTNVREVAPVEFTLKQNYPNPFNPSTEIKFSVQATDRATLAVYNLLGQQVATLFDGIAEAGQYHKVTLSAENLSSGMYFYRLQSGKRSELKKLIVLR